jgi:Ca2+-binding RTX toxin-like protein
MADKPPTNGQDKPGASAQGEVRNVTFPVKAGVPIILHVGPGDKLNFHNIHLDKVEINITGRDVIITDTVTGQKLIMPELGLYLFSKLDAPYFLFDGVKVTGDDLLGHVGVVNNLSENDFVSFSTFDLSHAGDKAAQGMAQAAASDAAAAAKAAAASAAMLAMAAAQPQQSADNIDAAPPTPQLDPLLLARQSLLADSQGVPPAPVSSNPPPTPASSSGAPPVVENLAKGTSASSAFNFSADLLQVGATNNTATTGTYLGGNGSEAATLDPSSNVQYSTQIIDVTSNPNPLTIYANDPAYFTPTEMTRVVAVKPFLPDGFNVASITVTGLPVGYTILGASLGAGNTYTMNAPTLNSAGAIAFNLQYGNTPQPTFILTMTVSAKFDTNSSFPLPNFQEFTLAVVKTVQTAPVNGPSDYVFTDVNGNPGWVLATLPNASKILGGDGNDTIYGGDGGNVVIAGNGNNAIYGGLNNDAMSAGSGNNVFFGSHGNDTYTGGSGVNAINFATLTTAMTIDLSTVDGNGYASAAKGGGEIDLLKNVNNIVASSGNNDLTGNNQNNSILGGAGNDTVHASLGNDTLNGGTGVNTLTFANATNALTIDMAAGVAAGWGNDAFTNFQNLIGSNYGDTITGSTGNDNILGGTGADLFYASLGNDTLDAGTGINAISFVNATSAMTVNLATGTATGWGNDTLSNFQMVAASNFGDTITGNGNNTIFGGTGNDLVSAGGNALVYASLGNDTLDGGAGSNTINFLLSANGMTINLTAGTATGWGNDTLTNFHNVVGSNHGDTITGSVGNDSIVGGTGNNYFYITAGVDTLNGGVGGSNTLDFSAATAASTINLMVGTTTGFVTDSISNFSTIVGSNFGDTITGSTGNDSITGGSGNNTVFATTGIDTLNGGVGGTNTLNFTNATTASTINLTTGLTTGWATDSISNFRNLIGSNHGDTITGSTGSDSITGGTGNDQFFATIGNDTLAGGAGTNSLSFTNIGTAVTLHIDTGIATDAASNTTAFSAISRFTGSNNGDTIYGSTGNDSVLGGTGADTFYASLGNDTLNGGSGSNTINFVNATSAVTVNLAAGTATGWGNDTLSNFRNVIGSSHGDTITGSTGNDSITGGSGNDLLYAITGNDTFVGGGGTDALSYTNSTAAISLHLDTGSSVNTSGATATFSGITSFVGSNLNDTIYGSSGNDSVLGGSGTDLFYASLGNDTLNGGAGTNTINFVNATAAVTVNLTTGTASGWGADTLSNFTKVIGSSFGDTITGSTGNNSITGGTGNDLFNATIGNDTYVGGGGTDTLSYAGIGSAVTLHLDTGSSVDALSNTNTFSGIASFIGSNNGDTIYGSTANDSVLGGSGNDQFYASLGLDTLSGGGGTNTINFANATNAMTVNLTTGTATGWGTDTLTNFQNIIGSSRGDTITGSTGNNSITGGSGNDLFNSTIGNDTYVGGGGTDRLSFAGSVSAVTLHLDTATSTDAGGNTTTYAGITSFTGSNNGDTIYGSTGNDSVLGGSGNNLFYASLGLDTLNGGVGGSNTITFVNATAAVNVNLTTGISSGWGTDTLSNFQKIVGSNFGDTITGSIGDDSITGGTGNDLIYATLGSDTLSGGAGTNTLSFANATSASTINLTTGATTGWATDTISNFTKVIGSNNGDTITGSTGNDSITGGSGSDLFMSTIGNDTYVGGGGSDRLSFANSVTAVTLHLDTGTATDASSNTDTFSGVASFIGSNNGDTVYGSTGSDSVLGGSGNNFFYASLGNDTLNGGVGGSNTLSFVNATTASTINLTLGTSSGRGSDTISNFAKIIGSNFGDTITGSTGNNSITGGTGSDLFYATTGNDTFVGGGGTDTLSYANIGTAVTLHLDTGASTDAGGNSGTFSGITRFVGSNHNDTIYGSTGNDSVLGGSGNNLFYASLGADTLNGGVGGVNTINFSNATATVAVNLAAGTASGWGTDTLSNFQNVVGSDHGDIITGSIGNNSITGGTGSDLLYVTGGNDTFVGGGGTDTLSYANIGSSVTLHLDTGTSTDTASDSAAFSGITSFVGSNHNDTIFGSTGNDSVLGGSGNNVFFASLGADTLNGGVGGTNTINFSSATGALTVDLTAGTASGWGTDTLSNFTKVVGSNFGDTITGSTGSDSITGGSGNDLIFATLGSDTLRGGGGTNTLSFVNATSASTINLTTGATTGYATDTVSNFTKLIGSNFGDTITGSTGNDSVTGGAGNDLFYATGGNDTIAGVSGTDTLSFNGIGTAVTLHLDTNSATDAGGDAVSFTGVTSFVGSTHNDTIYGSTGNDSVLGGSGNNLFYATLGNDTLNGGVGGVNTINFANATAAVTVNLAVGTATGWGTDNLNNFQNVIGSTHGDTITGSSGNNSITGGSGNDLFYVTIGNDTFAGGGGTDTLSYTNIGSAVALHLDTGISTDASSNTDAFSGIASFVGTNHGDTIYGSTGNDSVLGGSGSNIFYASLGNDTLNGGAGTNTINFVNATTAVTIDLTAGTASGWGTDTLSNFTKVVGSNFGDTITGSTGSDSITGGSGSDLIIATLGSDTLSGGGGVNTLSFVNATAASTINLTTGTTTGWVNDAISNFTKVIGSNFGDTITGSTGNNSITGGTGNDLFYVTGGNDTFVGGTGTDTLSYTNMGTAITLHLDTGVSTDGTNTDSFSGITSFVGSSHNDTVYGSTGNDSVLGGSGNNLYYASLGNDTFNGGVGGTNTINFVNATSAVTANLTTGTATGWGADTLSNIQNIVGSNFGDTLTGSTGNNSITGGTGADLIYATLGLDTLSGGAGTNTLSFVNATSASNINLTTGTTTGFATDVISNFSKVIGSNFGDTLTGSTVNDSLTGGLGNDLFMATTGNDTVVGVAGVDTLSFANITTAVTLHLDTNTATDTGGDIVNFSGITSFVGTNLGDTIYGSAGDDSLTGGAGNDLFYASLGNDTLNGAGGVNTIDFINATSAVTVNLTTNIASGWGADTLSNFQNVIASNQGDTITGSTGNNSITGGTGNDLFLSTAGNDTYVGGGGTDRLSFTNSTNAVTLHLDTGTSTDTASNATTFSGVTRFTGSNNNDTIYGASGNDSFLGGSGNNLVFASLGNDTLNGGVGGVNTIYQRDGSVDDQPDGGDGVGIWNGYAEQLPERGGVEQRRHDHGQHGEQQHYRRDGQRCGVRDSGRGYDCGRHRQQHDQLQCRDECGDGEPDDGTGVGVGHGYAERVHERGGLEPGRHDYGQHEQRQHHRRNGRGCGVCDVGQRYDQRRGGHEHAELRECDERVDDQPDDGHDDGLCDGHGEQLHQSDRLELRGYDYRQRGRGQHHRRHRGG